MTHREKEIHSHQLPSVSQGEHRQIAREHFRADDFGARTDGKGVNLLLVLNLLDDDLGCIIHWFYESDMPIRPIKKIASLKPLTSIRRNVHFFDVFELFKT